jgi:hypothetical protein
VGILLAMFLFVKNKRDSLAKKQNFKRDIKKIYAKLLTKRSKMSPLEVNKMKMSLSNMFTKQIAVVKGTEMLEEEKQLLVLFFTPNMINASASDLESICNHIQITSHQSIGEPDNHNNNNSITQPLLEMIRKKPPRKEIQTPKNTFKLHPTTKCDCIICFSAIENETCQINFPCKHFFHNNCIFDWLKINPTCPICRQNFRFMLFISIINFLNSL